MHMVHLHAQYGYAHALAARCFFQPARHLLGEHHQPRKGLVVEVEDIVRLGLGQLGDNQRMPFLQRVDVQECIIFVVLRYLVRRNLTIDDSSEECHCWIKD